MREQNNEFLSRRQKARGFPPREDGPVPGQLARCQGRTPTEQPSPFPQAGARSAPREGVPAGDGGLQRAAPSPGAGGGGEGSMAARPPSQPRPRVPLPRLAPAPQPTQCPPVGGRVGVSRHRGWGCSPLAERRSTGFAKGRGCLCSADAAPAQPPTLLGLATNRGVSLVLDEEININYANQPLPAHPDLHNVAGRNGGRGDLFTSQVAPSTSSQAGSSRAELASLRCDKIF